MSCSMRLKDVLDSCGRMEERAAAIYRRFAQESRPDSPYASLWEDLAREEDGHAAAVHEAQWNLPSCGGWRVRLEGWNEAIQAMVDALQRAEHLPASASDDDRATTALGIELGEMDALRHAAIGAVSGRRMEAEDDHLSRLADAVARHSSDPHVLTLASIARARHRLAVPR